MGTVHYDYVFKSKRYIYKDITVLKINFPQVKKAK